MKGLAYALSLTVFLSNVFAQQPKLVVLLVIDQLRADIIYRYQNQFGKSGFNRLIDHSIDYRNATHKHANTVTCVGHATIATGAPPAYHGIVANNWFDRASNRRVYCAEDPRYPQLSQPRNFEKGRSPRWLTTTTLPDEWCLANKGQAYAISYKDRSAIMLAGHSGTAFWFDRNIAQVTTSTFYHRSLPEWVNKWNKNHPAKAFQWNLSRPISSYYNQNAPRFANRFPSFNINFPHSTGKPGEKQYKKFLSMTPVADQLISQFAIALLREMKLGTKNSDYLAISYSSNDAIGHQFGPNSLESEDNLYRLDKEIAKLLDAIDEQVGLDNTLIILTADHGVKDTNVDLVSNRIKFGAPKAESFVYQIINQFLTDKWHLKNAIRAINIPYVYLNHRQIANQHLDVEKIKRALATALNGIAPIFRVEPMPYQSCITGELDSLISAMSVSKRSGDLYIVPFPNHSLRRHQAVRVAHGSPWLNDRSVPLLVFNGRWRHQIVYRPVATTDIAPTISILASIKKPASSVGLPLIEVLKSS